MRLCKHEPHKVIDDIWRPKYSSDTVKIGTHKVPDGIEHFLIKFSKCNKYPDWFYMSGKTIRRHKVVPNGRGFVYEVPMSKREEFEAIKNCEHAD